MMTERERERVYAHKNVDKMEELDASLFPQRSRAFAQTEGRLFGRFPFSSSDDSKNTQHARSVVPPSLDCTIIRAISFARGGSE
jgi:hypothetical protein